MPAVGLITAKYPDSANVGLCCFQLLCLGLEFISEAPSLFWPLGANTTDVGKRNTCLDFGCFGPDSVFSAYSEFTS